MNLAEAVTSTPSIPELGAQRNRQVVLAGARVSKTREGKPSILILEKAGNEIVPCAKFLADSTPLGGESKYATAADRLSAMLDPLGVMEDSTVKLQKLQGLKVTLLESVEETQDGNARRWRCNWISPVLTPESGDLVLG